MTPTNPSTSNPPAAPENHSVTTSPDTPSNAPQYNTQSSYNDLLAPILRRIRMPQPSGEVRIPPADAAVLVVRVPDGRADVLLDGETTDTEGATRWFVTPTLPAHKTQKYKVCAYWQRDGGEMKGEQEVEVSPGRITVVDFTRPENK
jgi:uncharacterized protein (TIGR03000 family)